MTRFCPNCGAADNGSKFCASCGDALRAADRAIDGATDSSQSAEVEPGAPGAESSSSRTVWIVGGSVIVLFAVVLGAMFLSGGGSSNNGNASSAKTSEDPDAQECIKRWNSQMNGDNDNSDPSAANYNNAASSIVESMANRGDVYVSAGFAEDAPDRCLVTVATPDNNQMAEQFVEQSSGAFLLTGGDSTINDLPDSVTHWNAHLDFGSTMLLHGTDSSSGDVPEGEGSSDY